MKHKSNISSSVVVDRKSWRGISLDQTQTLAGTSTIGNEFYPDGLFRVIGKNR